MTFDHCTVCGKPKSDNTSPRCRHCYGVSRQPYDPPNAKTDLNQREEIVSRYLSGERPVDLSRAYGLSRERIRQILAKSGAELPTRERVCSCGQTYYGRSIMCPECRRVAESQRQRTKTNSCPICGEPISTRAVHCLAHRSPRPRAAAYAQNIYEVIRRYRNGETGTKLAKDVGVCNRTIYLWLRAANVEIRPAHNHKVVSG